MSKRMGKGNVISVIGDIEESSEGDFVGTSFMTVGVTVVIVVEGSERVVFHSPALASLVPGGRGGGRKSTLVAASYAI